MTLLDLPQLPKEITGARLVQGIIGRGDVRDDGTASRRLPERAAKPYCQRGHKMTLQNTYITTYGTRQCRQCKRLTDVAWKAIRKQREGK